MRQMPGLPHALMPDNESRHTNPARTTRFATNWRRVVAVGRQWTSARPQLGPTCVARDDSTDRFFKV